MIRLETLASCFQGLIPAIVQDSASHRVLMMAWMNAASIEKTGETGVMHYWSRSRKTLWLKGETSGHTQRVVLGDLGQRVQLAHARSHHEQVLFRSWHVGDIEGEHVRAHLPVCDGWV